MEFQPEEGSNMEFADAFESLMREEFPSGIEGEASPCGHTPAQHASMLVIGAVHAIFSLHAVPIITAAAMESRSLHKQLTDGDLMDYLEAHWLDISEEHTHLVSEWGTVLCSLVAQFLAARSLPALRLWITTPDGWYFWRAERVQDGWTFFCVPPQVLDE